MGSALIWLHVSGNIVWIGAILAAVVVMTSGAAEPKVRGALAAAVYGRLAVPAFVVSFVCGAIRLGLDAKHYLVESHWMHPKLTLALVVIGLHHVVGARAKKLASGAVADAGPAGVLGAVLGLCAIGAAFFAIVQVP
jgi:putative membrane protein